MAKREKAPEFTSPIATFVWPKLHEPDTGTDEYPKDPPEYSVGLRLSKDDPATVALLNKMKPVIEQARAEAAEKFANLPLDTRKKLQKKGTKGPVWNDFMREEYDQDTEEPTGDVIIKASMKSLIEVKRGPNAGKTFELSPRVFDAQGQPIEEVPPIFGGTRGRITFSAHPYFVPANANAGVSLRLQGVQIVDLVSAGGRTADSLGFGAVDGYTHSAESVEKKDDPMGDDYEGRPEDYAVDEFVDRAERTLEKTADAVDEFVGKMK